LLTASLEALISMKSQMFILELQNTRMNTLELRPTKMYTLELRSTTVKILYLCLDDVAKQVEILLLLLQKEEKRSVHNQWFHMLE
jgi:hypothetical protein